MMILPRQNPQSRGFANTKPSNHVFKTGAHTPCGHQPQSEKGEPPHVRNNPCPLNPNLSVHTRLLPCTDRYAIPAYLSLLPCIVAAASCFSVFPGSFFLPDLSMVWQLIRLVLTHLMSCITWEPCLKGGSFQAPSVNLSNIATHVYSQSCI